jgi:undecaprenyl diphosphate synthase
MKLFEDFLSRQADKIIEKGIRLKFIGKLDMFSDRLQKLMIDIEEKSKKFNTTLFMAMSYGGRLEIVDAVKKLQEEKTIDEIEDLTEAEFEKYL